MHQEVVDNIFAQDSFWKDVESLSSILQEASSLFLTHHQDKKWIKKNPSDDLSTFQSSWIWRAICKLRSEARPLLLCEVGSGITASFWQDNWTNAGPLIELVGERGPLVTGLSIDAVVADALTSDGWWLDRSRSRSLVITLLRACLPNAQEILASEVDDRYVWFPVRVERTALSQLLKLGKRCITLLYKFPGTRQCGLQEGYRSTHSSHGSRLGIECNQVWSFFVSRLHLSPPVAFEEVLIWLKAPSHDDNVTLIIRLIYQAVLYLLWKERNKRIHTAVEKPPVAIIAEIQQLIKLRLDPLARRQVFELDSFGSELVL
ncbi:uncharacterized protein LOC108808011 [Raphanus sativus]|uniref:Uncharacterized protein LOC108808011 n=1 Tax=Raphanus sativus TaxID=3726 RepID=A0A9W3BUI4_RAPSA|nr:uncharacterized protein LOC108808011 [Raphanus sativus]